MAAANRCAMVFVVRDPSLGLYEASMDLKNPKWMYLKAALFVVIGVSCFALVWLGNPTVATAIYLVLMIWAFARAYYFAFYVVEKYIDDSYRFSGLASFLLYLVTRRRQD